jgi:hypothetical protein
MSEMAKSSEEMRQEIIKTRAEMDDTLAVLEERIVANKWMQSVRKAVHFLSKKQWLTVALALFAAYYLYEQRCPR